MRNNHSYPRYLASFAAGRLQETARQFQAILASCRLCPRSCGVNRLEDERGFCATGRRARICSYMPHHGEEPPLSGSRGSGTIFFSGCTMGCVYCQNHEFSQSPAGREVEPEELAGFMLELQALGCHNINLVTPTHVLPQILAGLCLAIPRGLALPLVYNTSGYELPELVAGLGEVVDIYLPDMRYAEEGPALKYSGARGYPGYNQAALKEMHRQVGIPRLDARGVIRSGLIVRHLVLPNGISGTARIMRFISDELSVETYVSLMSQYFPCYRAQEFPELSRRLTHREYAEAQSAMEEAGLSNGWCQEGRGLLRFAGTNIKPTLGQEP